MAGKIIMDIGIHPRRRCTNCHTTYRTGNDVLLHGVFFVRHRTPAPTIYGAGTMYQASDIDETDEKHRAKCHGMKYHNIILLLGK
ncbi:hypothetical protein ACHAXS_009454 [Conticribra weissflogii]